MVGYHIDTAERTAGVVNGEGIDFFHDMCRCDCIDIVRRLVGGTEFYFVIDDEGLLKPNPVPCAFSDSGDAVGFWLFGSTLIYGVDDEACDLRSLTTDELDVIADNMWTVLGVPMVRLDQ